MVIAVTDNFLKCLSKNLCISYLLGTIVNEDAFVSAVITHVGMDTHAAWFTERVAGSQPISWVIAGYSCTSRKARLVSTHFVFEKL